jgi:hypothetical protein
MSGQTGTKYFADPALRRRLVLHKYAVLGLAGSLVSLTVVSPSSAGRISSAIAPALIQASELGPSKGGPSTAAHAWIPLHAKEFALAKAAANARAHVGDNRGKPGGGGGGSGPTVSTYSNVSPSFNGTYQSGITPPDTTGAMGPDRYIETVNTQYAIYARNGRLIKSGTLSSLTGISGGLFGYGLSDPQMMWDAETQRFYYSAVYYDLFLSDIGLAVGWSKTATPASSSDFCKYAIQFGSDLPDYPKLGDSPDFLLFGYNKFGAGGSIYEGSEFVTLNKPAAGSACAPPSAFAVYTSGVLYNADSSLAATPVPANLVDDYTGAGYVVANADLSVTPSADFVSIYTVTTNGADANGIPIPAISGPTSVPVATAYSMPASAPQKNSSYLLDTLDGRFEAAVAAVDPGHANKLAVWTAHAVFGGAGAEERWYELDPAAGSVLQSGAATSPSLFIWNGAVSSDRANYGAAAAFGDGMAMSVSTSSSTDFPAIQFLWKKGGSAQSALTNLVQAAGPSTDFSCPDTGTCRWGDYSGASPDPGASPSGSTGKIWLGNQYNLANGSTSSTAWRTWLFGVTPTN